MTPQELARAVRDRHPCVGKCTCGNCLSVRKIARALGVPRSNVHREIGRRPGEPRRSVPSGRGMPLLERSAPAPRPPWRQSEARSASLRPDQDPPGVPVSPEVPEPPAPVFRLCQFCNVKRREDETAYAGTLGGMPIYSCTHEHRQRCVDVRRYRVGPCSKIA